jgi:uncharacterized membrane protein
MWREISEKPQTKRFMGFVVTALAVMGAFNTLSAFRGLLARHEHILLIVFEVIMVLIIVLASYALVYMSIQTALYLASLLGMSIWHLIFRHGKPKTQMNSSTQMKWFLTVQAISLVLTICISIATYPRNPLTVFTYWSDKARQDEYYKSEKQEERNQEKLRECDSDPNHKSAEAQRKCYEEYLENSK